jgi:hypothetical protein
MSIQYAGGTNVHTTFSGVTKNDLLSNIPGNLLTAGWTQVSGNTPTVVTVTIASPAVVSWTSHGLAESTRVVFSTTGALPTGLAINTVYFVRNPLANSFNLATTAGGTVINTSGTQSGVHTLNAEILMQTATTPQGYNIRCRMRDNGGTCVQFSIESADGTKVGNNSTTQGGSLRPAAAKTWHIVACQYQFFMWVDADFNVGNEFMCVSCPYVFPFLVNSSLPYIGIMQSAGRGDGTGLNGGSGNWRWSIYNTPGDNSQNWAQTLYGTIMVDSATSPGSGNTGGTLGMIPQNYSGNANAVGTFIFRYGNADLSSLDPLIGWGLTSISDEFMIRGQLWDAIVITDQFLGDTTTSFDSHNWIALTSSQTSTTSATLFVVTP